MGENILQDGHDSETIMGLRSWEYIYDGLAVNIHKPLKKEYDPVEKQIVPCSLFNYIYEYRL